jgi:hypothetical protein
MQFTGHGENHMVMVAGQQARPLLVQPALDLQPGTLGAQPVPTRVVPDPLNMPVGAALHMPAQHRRTTGPQGQYRLPHIARHLVALCKSRIALLQDLLHRHPDHRPTPTLRTPSPALCGLVQRRLDCRIEA